MDTTGTDSQINTGGGAILARLLSWDRGPGGTPTYSRTADPADDIMPWLCGNLPHAQSCGQHPGLENNTRTGVCTRWPRVQFYRKEFSRWWTCYRWTRARTEIHHGRIQGIKCRNANCDNAVEISDATALARLIHFVDYATVVAREVDLNGHFFPINCRRQSLCQIPIRLRFLLIKMQDASLGPIRNRFKIYDENGLDKIKIHEHLCWSRFLFAPAGPYQGHRADIQSAFGAVHLDPILIESCSVFMSQFINYAFTWLFAFPPPRSIIFSWGEFIDSGASVSQ